MKVLVCGSRDWTDRQAIHKRLSLIPYVHPDIPVIIHGGARGADRLAAEVARDLGMTVLPPFLPEWEPGPDTRVIRRRADGTLYDPEAGFRRNRRMLDERPDCVLAFQRNGSRGTQHTIAEARRRGIPVEVHRA